MQSRRSFWFRFALAGPGAIVVAILVMLGMPIWMPGGSAGIDNIIFPILLLPLIWGGLFFHACLDTRMWRIAAVALLLAGLNGALIAWHFSNTAKAPTEAKP